MEVYPNTLFLTDDAAARLAAEQRGYRVHGTIGLLIRSARVGRRKPPEVLALLRAIPHRSTLFVRASLLDGIVARLEREWTREV
jgi:predicted nucleic acid-binding protein